MGQQNSNLLDQKKKEWPVNKPQKVMTGCTIWNLHKEDKQQEASHHHPKKQLNKQTLAQKIKTRQPKINK
jgi:hypothetical protein